MSSKADVNIHVLDAAYTAFPSFSEWACRTKIDTVRWERYNFLLESHAKGLSPEMRTRAREIAKRAAAVDTGAIEGLYEVDRGFTYSVAVQAATWEAAMAQKGEHVRPLFEAQLHAYDYVLDLATKAEPISEAAIRALHEVVCRAQKTYRVKTAIGPQEQELPKGRYKSLPNHVRTRNGTDHSYAPVDVTPAEMARFTSELRTRAFLSAHPALQAAYAHYCFVAIHPFADGNGRVARALASAFTYGAISMPIVILSDLRESYLASLEDADRGKYQCFVDFLLDRCLDTIGLVDQSLQSALAPSAEQSIQSIQALYRTRGGYTHEEVDGAGGRLMDAFNTAVIEEFARHQMPYISFSHVRMGSAYAADRGYRLPVNPSTILQFTLRSQPPAVGTVNRSYGIWLPIDAGSEDDIQLARVDTPKTVGVFAARVDELLHGGSGALAMRLKMFAEWVANEMLAELNSLALKSMGKGQ